LKERPAAVLDASALLAHLNDEVGADVVEDALVDGSVMSAANLAEVLSKLAEVGEEPEKVYETLLQQGLLGGRLAIEPLTPNDAVIIAELHRKTRSHGLSLGDRACLALATRLQVPALTADRSWTGLGVGIRIKTIR
jgi:PIN domain nuclease of toxin-antitoxin system